MLLYDLFDGNPGLFFLFFLYFRPFQIHITNFTTNRYVKNVHPVYGVRIQTLEHQPPPITTRPGLPPQINESYLAISEHPFAQAAWSGVQESSSWRLMSDPWPIRILTTFRLLSSTAWWRAVKPGWEQNVLSSSVLILLLNILLMASGQSYTPKLPVLRL